MHRPTASGLEAGFPPKRKGVRGALDGGQVLGSSRNASKSMSLVKRSIMPMASSMSRRALTGSRKGKHSLAFCSCPDWFFQQSGARTDRQAQPESPQVSHRAEKKKPRDTRSLQFRLMFPKPGDYDGLIHRAILQYIVT